MDAVRLREARPEDGPALAELVRALPQWFTPDVVEKAPADAARFPTVVAVDAKGAVLGALVWKLAEAEAEIEWLLVAPGLHRRGLGRRMVGDLVEQLQERGVARLTVATLAASIEYEPYARTRAFYEALGFALEQVETAGWPDGTDKATYALKLKEAKVSHGASDVAEVREHGARRVRGRVGRAGAARGAGEGSGRP